MLKIGKEATKNKLKEISKRRYSKTKCPSRQPKMRCGCSLPCFLSQHQELLIFHSSSPNLWTDLLHITNPMAFKMPLNRLICMTLQTPKSCILWIMTHLKLLTTHLTFRTPHLDTSTCLVYQPCLAASSSTAYPFLLRHS